MSYFNTKNLYNIYCKQKPVHKILMNQIKLSNKIEYKKKPWRFKTIRILIHENEICLRALKDFKRIEDSKLKIINKLLLIIYFII